MAGVEVRVIRAVGEALAAQRIQRSADKRAPLALDDERELARTTAGKHLDMIAAEHLANGLTPMDEIEERELIDAVLARVLGLGRIQALLDDPLVGDIHIRGCSSTRLKLTDGRRVAAAPVVDTDDELVELVRLAATRLGRSERRFDAASPELNMQLPDGSRLFAAMDISSRPTVVVRKHRFDLSSMSELQDRGLVDEHLRTMLCAAVRARRNIVIAGGTGTGKTTLLRALLNEIEPDQRLVTIEDAYELGLDRFEDRHPDYDMLQSRPANIEGRGEVSIADLTRMALRMDPDRVIVGEVRGAEAFPMVMAMTQGNNGSMCTMHADSSRSVLAKLAAYVSMADTGLPIETVNLLLASALDLVVHIEIVDGVRRVTSVREVLDAHGASVHSRELFTAATTDARVAAGMGQP